MDKVYNVVVNIVDDDESVYDNVRSFKSFEGAERYLRAEYDEIIVGYGEDKFDNNEYDSDKELEFGYFNLDDHKESYFASGSIYVCQLED
jgi:hypothetical protein